MARRLENVIFNGWRNPIAVLIAWRYGVHGTCHGCKRYKLLRQTAYFTLHTKGIEGKKSADFHAITCAEKWLKEQGNT